MLSAAHLTQRNLRTKESLALCQERFEFTPGAQCYEMRMGGFY